MKRVLLLCMMFCGLSLDAKGSDTTFIKRPYYLGITIGYTQLTHALAANRFVAPVNQVDVRYARQLEFGFSPALEFSFPFLRRMEFESDLQRTTWFGTHAVISGYHYASQFDHTVVGFQTIRDWFNYSVWQVRAVFSYELKRSEHFALLLGAGGRLDMQDVVARNNYGVEVQLKSYVGYPHFGNLGLALYAGGNQYDLYGGLSVAYLLKGTRTYRTRPSKYYVRTYEDGE